MDEIDRLIARTRAPWVIGPDAIVEIMGPPDERWGDDDSGLLLWHGPDPRAEPVLDLDAVTPEARALAGRFAEALTRVVPAPAGVLERHGAVVLLDAGRAATMWDVQRWLDEKIVAPGAARQLLEQLQDDVAHITTTPWPGEHAFPEPGTRVRDGRLEWWYGPEDDPVLVLDSVVLTGERL
jgi:hypothetical protein